MDTDGIIHNIENTSAVNEQQNLAENSPILEDIIHLFTLSPSKEQSKNFSELSPEKKDENRNKFLSLIKNENLQMICNIIEKEELFKKLNNEFKFVLAEHLSHEKTLGQEYITKILKNSDDELILLIVKNKEIYNNLNRNNRFIVMERLLSSPWISSEETKKMVNFVELENKIDLQKNVQKKIFKNIVNPDSVKNFFMNKRADNLDLLGEL